MFNQTLQLLNISLFITNLWIILYNALLGYLNFLRPPVVQDKLYRPAGAFPEPFDLPLYFILTFIFVLVIVAIQKLARHFPVIKRLKINLFIFLFLLLVFISHLGSYPLAGQFYPFTPRQNQSFYDIRIILYLVTVALIIAETTIVFKLFKNASVASILLYVWIFFLIGFFVFEAGFPIRPHDYSFFLGPLWEIIKGKTIFTDIPSQYGFLSVLVFVPLYKFGIFSFSHLSMFVFIIQIVQYFIDFYLIYKVSKSLPLALIGLFSIFTINYLSLFVLPLTLIQYGAMRRIPIELSLLLLYKKKKIDSRIFLFLYAVSVFWIIDTGAAMLFALGFSLFLWFLHNRLAIRNVIFSFVFFSLSLIGIFALLNFTHIIFGYKQIAIVEAVNALRLHSLDGLLMIPMPAHSYFWITMLIYFAIMIYLFTISEWDNNQKLILLSANLMFFANSYFVGRSHDANLFNLSNIILLNLFLLIGVSWKTLKNPTLRILFACFLLFIFIVLPAIQRKYTIAEMIEKKVNMFLAGNIFQPALPQELESRFAKEKKLIAKNLKDDEVLILSGDDTYLYIVSDKKNLLDYNPQSGIGTEREMKSALKRALRRCPQKIAVDCNAVGKCQNINYYTNSWPLTSFILDTLQKDCRTIYKPTVCTDTLCIAQKT